MTTNTDYALLESLSHKHPVPADCPAYLKVVEVRRNFNPHNIRYIGNLDWCETCCIYGTYCDGNACKPNINEEG